MHIKYACSFALIFLLFFLVPGLKHANAQTHSDLIFSEILVNNESNYIDDYGSRSAWIEIHNSSENAIDIGGYYLTNDISNPTKYWIPEGDYSTIIKPKGYLLLWADGKPERGIFHLNFDLNNVKTIALFNKDGKSLIDKIEIPLPQQPDVTYGRLTPESNEFVVLSKSTPGTKNDLSKKVVSAEMRTDITGISNLAKILAIAIVVIVVIVLAIRKYGKDIAPQEEKPTEAVNQKQESKISTPEVPDEINVAIAMALHMYENDLHDNENLVLTLQKVSRTYSPWSSKIYTLRKLPR